MIAALYLLAVQGVIGAFDTLYYHEYRARLPARATEARPELTLHAARDLFYAVLFGTLPWIEWHGRYVVLLGGVIVVEIILTMWDFVVEKGVRKSLGDVFAGERVTHAVMGICYGAMIANLIPTLIDWGNYSTALVFKPAPVPDGVRWMLSIMAVGVAASGIRDIYAALGLPNGNWPWTAIKNN